MKLQNCNFKLNPGVYPGYISNYEQTQANNGTEFLRLVLNISDKKGRDFVLEKYYVTNDGKNSRLINFFEELEILDANGDVELDELLEFDFHVTIDRRPDGSLFVRDLTPFSEDEYEDEDIDFGDDR